MHPRYESPEDLPHRRAVAEIDDDGRAHIQILLCLFDIKAPRVLIIAARQCHRGDRRLISPGDLHLYGRDRKAAVILEIISVYGNDNLGFPEHLILFFQITEIKICHKKSRTFMFFSVIR